MAGAAGGAGDHSTVTDVADAAPHLRLFQRRESSGERQPNTTVLMYLTTALFFQRNVYLANIKSWVPSRPGNSPIHMIFGLNGLKMLKMIQSQL